MNFILSRILMIIINMILKNTYDFDIKESTYDYYYDFDII